MDVTLLDLNEIEQLLNIVEKTRQQPKLKALHDAALAHLHAIAAPEETAEVAVAEEEEDA